MVFTFNADLIKHKGGLGLLQVQQPCGAMKKKFCLLSLRLSHSLFLIVFVLVFFSVALESSVFF